MNKSQKSSAMWQRGLLIVLCAILLLALITLIFVTAYVQRVFNSINRPTEDTATLSSSELEEIFRPEDDETVGEDFTGPTYKEEDITLPTLAPDDPIIAKDGIINILLIGQDRRGGTGRTRSDTMMLCTFNTKKKTITMTSFMRDLYVQIPGYRATRLNAAYQVGGMTKLDETLAINFGVHVDANVVIDFSGFTKIINLLGGVEIKLTKKEANYLNKYGNVDILADDNTWNLKEGVNHLNAEQALAYSRIRKIDSDYQRTARQRNVMSALIKEYKGLSWAEMDKLLWEILPMISTDMSNNDIIGYAAQIFPMLSSAKIVSQRIPAAGMYENAVISGAQVIVPDLVANRALLKNTLG